MAASSAESPVCTQPPEPLDSPLLLEARRCVRASRWDEAALRYRELLVESPGHPEALEGLGLAALHGGRAAEGLDWLEQARRREPSNARVLVHLGIAQRRNGLLAPAIETFERAVALDPQPSTLLNLARAERAAGRLEPAIATFQRALALKPDAPEGWSMLSNALRLAGRLEPALAAAQQAQTRNPWLGEGHLNAGVALHGLGRLVEAVVAYWAASTFAASRAAALGNLRVALADPRLVQASTVAPSTSPSTSPSAQAPEPATQQRSGWALVRRVLEAPGDVAALLTLGMAERAAGRPATAIVCLERALAVEQRAEVAHELGALAHELGQREPAQRRLLEAFQLATKQAARERELYRRFAAWVIQQPRFSVGNDAWYEVLERCPDDPFSLINLGVTLQRQGHPSLAARLAQRASAIAPGSVEARLNLGSALCDLGRFSEAYAAYRSVLELDPTCVGAASNQLFCLHFDPSVSAEELLDAHVAFGARFCEPLAPAALPAARDPERRLRVGYVSPDLRQHPVALFLEPVLAHHDGRAVEVYCYSDAARPDEVSARLAALSSCFVDSRRWSDDELAQRVRADQIDILVDLAGHTAHHRLLAFARRPSPVQVSWLGYFDTTGLSAIDYRIADPFSVPPGGERWFVEQVVRLPRSASCFLHPPAPPPAAPPCLRRGHVTFGCFNNPAKLTREVIATFARVLRGAANSRLLLAYGAYDDPELRARYARWLADEGIVAERVDFAGHASLPRFLASFAGVDVALDPFPYSGETTALHTLWMGVPLVALEGATTVQRLASRVLRVAGLDDWVADSHDEYVRIALALASDPARLAHTRQALRARLEASPLCDHAGFTRELEAAYRAMWRRACAQR